MTTPVGVSRRMARRVALVMPLLLVGGCGSSSTVRPGAFIRPVYGSVMTDRNFLSPGERFAIMLVPLSLASPAVVRIRSVQLTGTGVGSVVKVVSIQAAPEQPARTATPETTYVTDPPVFDYRHHCLVQRLEPIDGLVLHRGQAVHVYVVLEAEQVGELHNTGYLVTYEANGSTYTQSLPVGYTTWVKDGVPPRAPHPEERPCLSRTHRL